MSEETVLSQPRTRRKGHPVLLTLLTMLCFLGLLAYRVWYSYLYLGAAADPRYLTFALIEAAAAILLLLVVLTFRQDFTLSVSMPVCVLVLAFLLLGFFAAYGTGFSRWLNIGSAMLYLPPFLFLLFLPLSGFTAAGEPVETGRAFLLFLILGVIPIGLLFLSGELEFVTVYLLTCILFALYIRKNGSLDVPGVLFWLLLLLVLAAVVALYGFRLREHFDVLRTRGRSDPEGYGVLLMQVDSIWQQIRWCGPSPLLAESSGTPWYTANVGYELVAVMIHGGIAAAAGMLICALGLVICLYRMHGAMRNSFARFVSFLTATVYLIETVWNLLSCFLGISARSDIPFLSSNLSVFAIEVILLGTVLSLFRQRRLPLADMDGDYWFRGAVRIEANQAPVPEAVQPSVSSLRNPALKKYLHPDRFYMDTRMELAAAEWERILTDARADGVSLPDNLNEELLPLCVLDDSLYLLIPFLSPYSDHGDPAADLAPLLERTSYTVVFLYESVAQPDAPEDVKLEFNANEADTLSEAVEDALAMTDLNFAAAREPEKIPDFDFTPVAPSESGEE